MVFQNILRFLDAQASTPTYFGLYHIIWILVTIAAAITLCVLWKKEIIKKINKLILVVSVALLVLGVYKQIVLSFEYDPAVKFVYDWDNFPWNFLSIPMCIGLFIGMTSESINKYLSSYFATFGLLAGIGGMFNPNTFVPTIGLNIYSMLCYGSFIALSVLILFSKQVKIEVRTFLKALPIFAMVISIAISFNEIVHLIIPNQKVSLFEISRHDESTIPGYSLLHNFFLSTGNGMSLIEYIVCILVYFIYVSAFAFLPLLIMIGIKKLFTTDFDAEYEKNDSLALGLRKSEGLDDENESNEIFRFHGKVNSKKNTYMKTYFENLNTNFGHNENGSCGYVATAMLLSYYDTILSDKIVPRQFEKNTLSHNAPDLKESPGSRFYQPPYNPDSMSYKEYINEINRRKNTYLHDCLLSLAVKKHLNDAPKDKQSLEFDFGSDSKDIKKVIEAYLKKIADVKGSEYDVHVKDNIDEIKKAKTAQEAKEYSEEIRKYAIRKVRKGYPVLLGIFGKQGHAVIAYDYDKTTDKLYCHFGYPKKELELVYVSEERNEVIASEKIKKIYTHLNPEEEKYNVYGFAVVLDFDERKISHTHTNNYEVAINGALFYYCPDGRYTTSDDLVVEFGPDKNELSITGIYKKYRKDQLTVPEYIGAVRVANIGKYAFENQEHLKRVVLSCNVPTIPKKAFEDCESLETVVIPASVKKIGSEAFGECFALTSIMYLGTKEEWFSIKKSNSWDRKTGNYRVYCTDGVLMKLSPNEQVDLI